MAERSRGLLFRKRNILGAALALGIGLGIYLGQFKGLGLGGSGSWGIGTSGNGTSSNGSSSDDIQATTSADINDLGEPDSAQAVKPSQVVKVLIDDRKYLLQEPKPEMVIALPKLIEQIKAATGDEHGTRVRIYQSPNARVSMDENLKQALVDAGIPDSAVIWVPISEKK